MTRSAARSPRPTATPPKRLQGDGGSLLLELALVAPFMVLIVLGIFEFGTVFRNQNIVGNSVRAAARVESQQSASTPTVDKLALQTFISSQNGQKNMAITRIIVYDAGYNTKAPPSPACLTAVITGSPPFGVAGVCNVYNLNEMIQVAGGTAPASAFGTCEAPPNGTSSATSWDSNWCPDKRNATLGSLDQVGVYAVYAYSDVTTLLPQRTLQISDYSVYAIQPTV